MTNVLQHLLQYIGTGIEIYTINDGTDIFFYLNQYLLIDKII